jgi:serine/threonine protein kinase
MERLLRKGNALEITAADWALLSPLVDEALDLAPKQRREWLEASEAIRTLAPAQRAQLDLLIAQSNEPETEDLFATLPQFGLKAHRYVDTFARGDRVGPYTLVEKIGTGGMSEVWRAYRSDGAYEREVALKLPYAHASVASREHFIRRMERERDLLARLEHPNIARFYDAGIAKTELGAQPYLALEYVNGQSITEYANAQRLTIEARCKLFVQVLDAVQYAHQRFVVHRDLKPSNILVRENGQVALLDFGIAKVLDEETQIGDATLLTREMGRAITIAYASPEQLLSEPITTSSDVYSAGVLFYELLCGKRPFSGHDHSMMSLLAVLETPPASLTYVIRSAEDIEPSQFGVTSKKSLTNKLSGDIAAIVAKSLRRDAVQRYISASTFAEDLQRFLDGQPVRAREGARLYSLQKFAWRWRAPLLVASALVLVTAGFGVTSFVQHQQREYLRAQTKNFEQMVAGLLDGMSPEVADKRIFTARELLDRMVASLPAGAFETEDSELPKRVATIYASIGAYENATKFLRNHLAHVDNNESKLDILTEISYHEMQDLDAFNLNSTLDEIYRVSSRLKQVPARTKLAISYLEFWRAYRKEQKEEARRALAKIDQHETLNNSLGAPWTTRIWIARARYAELTKSYNDAELCYRRVMEISSSKSDRATLLRAKQDLVGVWRKLRRYSDVLQLLPPVITEVEERFGSNDRKTLDAKFHLGIALLMTGGFRELESLGVALVQSGKDQYPDLGQRLLVEAALQSERPDVFEAQLAKWLSDERFGGKFVSRDQKTGHSERLKIAFLLQQYRNKEAYQLMGSFEEAAPKSVSRSINARYMSAITHLRAGNLERAKEALIELNGELVQENEPGIARIAIVAYLNLLRVPNVVLGLGDREYLMKRFIGNRRATELVRLLEMNEDDLDWATVPFFYFSDRS